MNKDDVEEKISEEDEAVFKKCKSQFDKYFSGERKIFDLL